MKSGIVNTSAPGTVTAAAGGFNPDFAANTALKAAARFWFAVTLAGQWIFACYVAVYFGSRVLRNGLAGLAETHLPNGYIPGDTIGNLAVAAHVFMAALILVAGPLQLIPQIRTRAPAFHHWNGRLYLLAVFTASAGGLYMVWTRGSISGLLGDVTITINAVLILVFAALALRHAIARDIRTHRRWALRLFLVASGVWFFRVGLMLWLLIHQAPVGFDPETFRGPFLSFLGFAQFLLPLAVLELYFHARDRAGAAGRFAVAGALAVLTVAMGAGIFAAAAGMWLPRI